MQIKEWTHAEIDGKVILPENGVFTFSSEGAGKDVTFFGEAEEEKVPATEKVDVAGCGS